MLGLQKIFLLVRFFNWISCNKDLKAKISCFLRVFSVYPPWGWNVLGAERPLCSWHHIGWRNTKICTHGASRMERKPGKCWKLPIFEGKLRVIISYLSKMRIVSMFYNSSLQLISTALFWRYLNSSMTRFSSDILLPVPNSNDLNSLGWWWAKKESYPGIARYRYPCKIHYPYCMHRSCQALNC